VEPPASKPEPAFVGALHALQLQCAYIAADCMCGWQIIKLSREAGAKVQVLPGRKLTSTQGYRVVRAWTCLAGWPAGQQAPLCLVPGGQQCSSTTATHAACRLLMEQAGATEKGAAQLEPGRSSGMPMGG
jgi:hypothetical protein